MKRDIFKRIFILYAAILVLALLFIEFSITGTLREQHHDGLSGTSPFRHPSSRTAYRSPHRESMTSCAGR